MKALHDALSLLLTTDATFVAAMQALNLGSTGAAATPVVVDGNQPFTSLGQEKFPCWVMEAGDEEAAPISDDGDGDGLTIGSRQQSFRTEIFLALVWHQQTPATAFAQRGQLAAAMVSLLLRNPAPAGTHNFWVERLDNDRQANHPTHVARFTLAALLTYTQ